jgi:hypothetical protein
MVFSRIALLLSFVFCSLLEASVKDNLKKGFHIDVGAIQTHLKQRLDSPAGYENFVSSLSGYVRFRGSLPIGSRWVWEPSLGTLIPWKSGPDGQTKKFTTHLDLTLSYPLTQWLRVRLGPGLKWLFSFSDGGEVVLNNGTSTSTFYTPGYASHSFTMTLQSGLGVLISSKLSLNLEVYGSGLAGSLRRNFDVAVTAGWRL